jgi:hypothetical protein
MNATAKCSIVARYTLGEVAAMSALVVRGRLSSSSFSAPLYMRTGIAAEALCLLLCMYTVLLIHHSDALVVLAVSCLQGQNLKGTGKQFRKHIHIHLHEQR